MRLIDADELCKEFRRRQTAALNWKEGAILTNNEESIIRADATLAFLSEVKLTIDNAPTVEPEPYFKKAEKDKRIYEQGFKDGQNARPQGEWIETMGEWVSEHCRKRVFKCSECELHFEYPFNFCPNCGAQMKTRTETD